VNDLIPIEDAVNRLTRAITVQLNTTDHTQQIVDELKPIFTRHKGNCDAFLEVPLTGMGKVMIKLDKQWSIKPSLILKSDLEHVLNGHGAVELAGDGTKRSKRLQQQQLFDPGEAPADPATIDPMPELIEEEV
jgi:hypothetical protein